MKKSNHPWRKWAVVSKKKQCCKDPNHYYQGDYELCLHCKFKKKKTWTGYDSS